VHRNQWLLLTHCVLYRIQDSKSHTHTYTKRKFCHCGRYSLMIPVFNISVTRPGSPSYPPYISESLDQETKNFVSQLTSATRCVPHNANYNLNRLPRFSQQGKYFTHKPYSIYFSCISRTPKIHSARVTHRFKGISILTFSMLYKVLPQTLLHFQSLVLKLLHVLH